MTLLQEIEVPASEGRGLYVSAGQLLEVVDVEGSQVGDLVAWNRHDFSEYMSPTHTVSCNTSIRLVKGMQLFTNRRNPIFEIVRDDVERHDIIVPCCDHERYRRDYGLEDHRHCLGNLFQGLEHLGEDFDLRGEMAWNVFMHNRVTEDGQVVTDPASHSAGSTITLQAHMDTVVLLSACPQDLSPCNAFHPSSMLLRLHSPGSVGTAVRPSV